MTAVRLFQDENVTQGSKGTYRAGVTNQDTTTPLEKGLFIPWVVDAEASYMDYQCWIESYLDSGLALHKPLPSSNPAPDTLASAFVSPVDASLGTNKNGVNLKSTGTYKDRVQRMATSHYRFCLKGYGFRIGYQIPIPGLKTVAGVPAIPDELQFATNHIVANYSGVPLWFARWELWYFVALPPKSAQTSPPNLAQHIRGDAVPPKSIQAPWSLADENAVAQTPPVINPKGQ